MKSKEQKHAEAEERRKRMTTMTKGGRLLILGSRPGNSTKEKERLTNADTSAG